MRTFAILVALSTAAYADGGGYLYEGLGGTAYRGALARYGGAPRIELGGAGRVGPTTIAVFGAIEAADMFYIDCYGAECNAPPPADLYVVGADVRQQWPLWQPRDHRHAGVWMFLHAGPRLMFGGGALEGRAFAGAGGGAGISGDVWLLGYYVDVGTDITRMREGFASTPYIVFGGKLGWM
jgi:hypothetical protein